MNSKRYWEYFTFMVIGILIGGILIKESKIFAFIIAILLFFQTVVLANDGREFYEINQKGKEK